MSTKRKGIKKETSIPEGTDVNEVSVRSTPKPVSTGHRKGDSSFQRFFTCVDQYKGCVVEHNG